MVSSSALSCDVFARVNVNRHQRFRLVDDDVPAALQHTFDFRALSFPPASQTLEQGNVFGVELNALHSDGWNL